MTGGGFSSVERRFLAGMAFLLGLRQLALLLALPFIALYATTLQDSTPALIGLSLGVYGLLQGLLQIPFGRWSDRFGRKSLILAGTLLLVAGLVLAAVATDIFTFIAARALQGAGAVTGVAYAWIADATPPERRNRAMGVVGVVSGAAAIASFVVGPLLYRVLTLPQIFLVCASLSGLVWVYLLLGVPAGKPGLATLQSSAQLKMLIGRRDLQIFFAAGFLLNYVLMSFIFALPLLADDVLGAQNLWKVLIPGTLAGVIGARLATYFADRDHLTAVTAAAFAAFLPGTFCLMMSDAYVIALGTAFFMSGYLALTALLPAGVTRIVAEDVRGSASGMYQTAQFQGAFLGGIVSGVLWQIHPGATVAALSIAAGAGLLVSLRFSVGERRQQHAGPMANQT